MNVKAGRIDCAEDGLGAGDFRHWAARNRQKIVGFSAVSYWITLSSGTPILYGAAPGAGSSAVKFGSKVGRNDGSMVDSETTQS